MLSPAFIPSVIAIIALVVITLLVFERAMLHKAIDQLQADLDAAREASNGRPPVGTYVLLTKDDDFLHRTFGVVAGGLGIIRRHSRLHPDDQGVLVHWFAPGQTEIPTVPSVVRCDLDELTILEKRPGN